MSDYRIFHGVCVVCRMGAAGVGTYKEVYGKPEIGKGVCVECATAAASRFALRRAGESLLSYLTRKREGL